MRIDHGKLKLTFSALLLATAAWSPVAAKPPLRSITAGVTDPSSDTITPSYRNIDPFYGNIGAFSGNLAPFYGNIGAFWGTLNPFYGNIGAFWGDLNPLYGNIGAFYGNIGASTETSAPSGMRPDRHGAASTRPGAASALTPPIRPAMPRSATRSRS